MIAQNTIKVLILFFMALTILCTADDLYANVQGTQPKDEIIQSASAPIEAEYALPSRTITTAIEETGKRQSEAELGAIAEADLYITANKHENQDTEVSNDNMPVQTPLGILYKKNDTAQRAIDKNIVFFSERLKERFSIWLERSARYLEIMKDILAERGLPEELVFLPIIESGFNMNAYSRASAVGPWQFISGTAKRYGLTIDWWRDERKDPIKSTEAAASYLRDLYKMFGAWHLALAAYNAGEGRIMRAMRSTGADDYWDLLNTKKIHPETKEYVPRYIAATKIARTPQDYGFEGLQYHQPFEFEEITINEPLDISTIALCAETTEQIIRELNPELRRWCTPFNAQEYTIRVPLGSKELFFENLETFAKDERVSFDTYIVQRGDTIKKVAQKTGFPVGVILAMNSLEGIESLRPGEKLKVPPKDKFVLDIDDRKVAAKVASKHKVLVKKVAYKKNETVKKSATKQKSANTNYKKSSTTKTKGKKT